MIMTDTTGEAVFFFKNHKLNTIILLSILLPDALLAVSVRLFIYFQ